MDIFICSLRFRLIIEKELKYSKLIKKEYSGRVSLSSRKDPDHLSELNINRFRFSELDSLKFYSGLLIQLFKSCLELLKLPFLILT